MMTFAEYQDIIESNTNWSTRDVYRLTCECYIKKLTKEETLAEIQKFTEREEN